MATKEELKSMDPDEVFNMEVPALDAALEELGIHIGKTWSSQRRHMSLTKRLGR